MAQIGARLRRLREAASLTQAEVGAQVGFAPQTVASWERGQREPNLETLVRLAAVFGCQVGQFFPDVDADPIEQTVVAQLATLSRQVRTLRTDFYEVRDRLIADGLVPAP